MNIMKITADLNEIFTALTAMAFAVNIIVQLTKSFIPIPTKLWCIIVAMLVNIGLLFTMASFDILEITIGYIVITVVSSFFISFIAMYGFDTLKSLWQRFKAGEV